jgi:calmodulin
MADHLRPDQIAEVKETFSLFDKAGSGSVTLDEMCTIFRALGQTPTQAELDAIKLEADPDNLNSVDFPELLSLYAKHYKEPVNEQDLLLAFKEIDENKRGTITVDKMKQLMTEYSEVMTEDEFSKMIEFASPDPEGNINYTEFVGLMMRRY